MIYDITKIFSREDVEFEIFKKLVEKGVRTKCILTVKKQKINQEVFSII